MQKTRRSSACCRPVSGTRSNDGPTSVVHPSSSRHHAHIYLSWLSETLCAGRPEDPIPHGIPRVPLVSARASGSGPASSMCTFAMLFFLTEYLTSFSHIVYAAHSVTSCQTLWRCLCDKVLAANEHGTRSPCSPQGACAAAGWGGVCVSREPYGEARMSR